MSEQNQVPPEGQQSSAENSWQEVGQQFERLGESLAQAVRTSWEDEETQRRVQEMRTGLESMVREVGQAIDDVASSQHGQRVKQEATRAAESLRIATEQTVQEVRPQLITALEQLNAELQKLIARMDERRAARSGEKTSDTQPPEDPQI